MELTAFVDSQTLQLSKDLMMCEIMSAAKTSGQALRDRVPGGLVEILYGMVRAGFLEKGIDPDRGPLVRFLWVSPKLSGDL